MIDDDNDDDNDDGGGNGDDDECGAVGEMSGVGNGSTRRKPASVPLYPPQIPHDLTLARTRAVAMGSYSLTA
jgi:hypothetical protein